MSLKVVEQYIQTLKEYTIKLKKDKITLLMQVGEFFEIYGLVYADGTKVGNVWEFCDNVNLKIALKPQVVYDDPTIQVYMGGVGESYINPYIQKAVERFGWTIVIFEQSRIGNSNKFERKEANIISPGININSDNFSNITMVIYMEQIRKYYSSSTTNQSKSRTPRDDNQINIGIAFVDCLTGENGIMAINNANSSDISIPLDELLKLLTIKNPNELYIHLENIDANQTGLTDDDLINALHLFNYNYKILREQTPELIHKLQYQQSLFERVYIRHCGLLDIMQQLNIEGAQHTYSRIALALIIEFITKHDKTIIEKLATPEIMINSDKYLMLANNCLEQLDIIDNFKAEYKTYNKRISLLELLDNTKTPLGKILLRQRLSMPITEEDILSTRYNQIDELLNLHIQYVKLTPTDKFGSPLHQLRQKLANIRNIENYLRKVITMKIQPFEVAPYKASLESCSAVYEYMKEFSSKSVANISKIIPNETHNGNFIAIQNTFQTDLILENMNCNVWNGVESNPFRKGINKTLDALQEEIDNDRGFLDSLLIELSKVIDNKWQPPATPSTTTTGTSGTTTTTASKSLIYVGENATKGIHIFTNTVRKDILEAYFAKPQAQLKVGNYRITAKDIKFLKMKESKWEIEIPLLKTSNGTLKANIDRIGKLAKQEFYSWLRENIVNQSAILDALNTFAQFIANIDVLQSNVLNVIEKGYTKPEIDTTASRSFMKADKIRHPIIEHINNNTKYVPNDITMGATVDGVDGVDGVLLFGVNAVGKSSLMKSLGINVIMAQAGMYVASSKFTYKPYKYLFTRIRNNDNLYAGLSSFEVEMKEFKVILKYADENSIILGDELFKGTQADDATALVASALEILSARKCNFIFATHLHNLTMMDNIKNLKNLKICHLLVELNKLNPNTLLYSRKLQDGSGPSSYGILVCEAMNIDPKFTQRAKEIRNNICNNVMKINNIGSKYNKDKVIAQCEICKEANASDVHHINQQCDANDCDLIDDIEIGIFNKNKLWNLVSLCKSCHQSVHSAPPRIKIDGYINTSNGIKLIYKNKEDKADKEYNEDKEDKEDKEDVEKSVEVEVEVEVDAGGNSDREIEVINSDDDIMMRDSKMQDSKMQDSKMQDSKMQDSKKKIKSVKGNVSELSNDLSDEIKKVILEMKTNNTTPKKIQFDMMRYHKLKISQQAIRDLK